MKTLFKLQIPFKMVHLSMLALVFSLLYVGKNINIPSQSIDIANTNECNWFKRLVINTRVDKNDTLHEDGVFVPQIKITGGNREFTGATGRKYKISH